MFPSHLTCDYLTDPLGIDCLEPSFCWRISDPDFRRGLHQTAYHIQAASSIEKLDSGAPDAWDSGKVGSDQSVLIPYQGIRLASGERYFWRVKIWCADAEGTKSTSDWSEVAQFSMGLLSNSDWKGSWIQPKEINPEEPNLSQFWYRKSFDLPAPVTSAFLHIASSGYHEVYLNGQPVDDRVLAPAVSRLDKRVRWVTYDLTSFLQVGKNVLGIHTGPGWSDYSFFKERGAVRALNAQVCITTINGDTLQLSSGSDWRCHPANGALFGDTKHKDMGGESLDQTKALPDWNQVGFDDSHWPIAESVDWDIQLSSHRIEPSRRLERLTAKSVEPFEEGTRFDLDRNATGFLSVFLKGQQRGDRILVQSSDRDDVIQNFGQASEYICSGDPEEQFVQRFNYCCGRYVTVTGFAQPPSAEQVCLDVVATDLRRTGTFSCSSELWNRIYETDLNTFQACTVEGYTQDCPHRERLGYGEVHTATAWGIGLPNYASTAFYSKLVEDWMDVQEENGWVHHTAPHITQSYGGTIWSSAGLNVAMDLYDATGDLRVLRKFYPHGKKWLTFLEVHTVNGVLQSYNEHRGKFLGDWAAPGGRKEWGDSPEASFFNSCVTIMNLTDMARMARVLGESSDAETYEARAQDMRCSVHQTFFDAERGTYMNDTQVQLAFALLTGVTPEEDRDRIVKRLMEKIEQEGYFDMGSSGLPVLFKFLIQNPRLAHGMTKPLLSTEKPSYGYFLEQGETAWPEYWEVNVRSRVHTCYTGVASWFMKSVCGIQPDPKQPGMKHVLLHPIFPENLEHAEGHTESLYGRISVAWKKQNEGLTVEVEIPPNTTATLWLPASDVDQIHESGKSLSEAMGINEMGVEDGHLRLHLAAGRYHFATQHPNKR